MQNEIEPTVGNWYQHLEDESIFQVIAVDEDEELVEFQNFDGDVGEVSLREWRNWDIEVTDPPEDWTGPLDDIDLEDLDYSETRSEGERRGQAQERRRRRLQDTGLPGDEYAEGADSVLVPGRATEREYESEEEAITAPRATRPGRRADGLSARRINQVKKRLTDRVEELRADIQRELRKYDRESYTKLAERVADPGDQAWADLVADMNLAEVSRDVGEIRNIERALQRLAEGNYGICIACGEEIDPERLEVNPAAVRCLECQRDFESRSRQSRPSL